MSFPTSLRNLTVNNNKVDGTSILQATDINALNAATDALEAKVGINNSTVTTSLDWIVTNRQVFAGIAVGTTSITSTTTEADMADMSITMTTKGTKLLCLFQASLSATAAGGNEVELYMNIAGNNKRTGRCGIYTHSDSAFLLHLETGLSAGSKTIKVRWKTVGALHMTQPGTVSPRVLVVLDIP